MIVKAYLVMQDGADRPYISTSRPTKERQEMLTEQGCELFIVDIELPERWRWGHGRVRAHALPMGVE